MSWLTLPVELKLSVIASLPQDGIKQLAIVDKISYQACVPALFHAIKIDSFAALERFLAQVPRNYGRYVHHLTLNTTGSFDTAAMSEAITAVLLASPSLQQLNLQLCGSIDKSVITCFAYLSDLTHFTLKNCGDEELSPVSERLAVSMAASLPSLQVLSMERISRSVVHASELVGVYPYVPLVTGDEDIPDHPLLGADLSLPSLLRIPTLKELTIRDTHLGDPAWATVPVTCKLQFLDLGSCCQETEDSNRVCTERIMAAVGRTVDEFSLATSVSDTIFAEPQVTPLQNLRKLHISPFFPVDSVVDTMSNLAGSPIESLSMQCYEDDVVDACAALEEFLALRVAKGSDFYEHLARIDVTVTSIDESNAVDMESCAERVAAAKRLQDFCRDLKLASLFKAKPVKGQANINRRSRWASDGRVRAMTI